MSLDPGLAGLILGTATAVPSLMGAFLPTPAAIVTGPADERRLAELRRGEMVGATITLVLTGGLALMLDRQHRGLVLMVALITVAVFVAEHERAIRISPSVNVDG